ncbi:hypothetical protein BC835DRAFT_1308536 [Cytidiella melzeri]|nr:hypothetical protein BC835DRAFT_1308536 [Cytidiella melzeri]
MPLDGHAHLVSQGWQGKGSGLRHGAINRPVIVAQKKTLSGIGKDRDEAFPFWDHVYSAAASAIKVKVYNDSDSEDTDDAATAITFQRTSTGIISNRRPFASTPASHSGTATPSSSGTIGGSMPRMSIMAAAKQEAAKRTLYSMFFRGPVLGTDIVEHAVKEEGPSVVKVDKRAKEVIQEADIAVVGETVEKKRKISPGDPEKDEAPKKQKHRKASRKGKEVAMVDQEVVHEEDEDIHRGTLEATPAKSKTKDRKGEGMKDGECAGAAQPDNHPERTRLKAEKRARKEGRRKRKEERSLKAAEARTQEASLVFTGDTSTSQNDGAEAIVKNRKKKDRGEEGRKKKPKSELS